MNKSQKAELKKHLKKLWDLQKKYEKPVKFTITRSWGSLDISADISIDWDSGDVTERNLEIVKSKIDKTVTSFMETIDIDLGEYLFTIVESGDELQELLNEIDSNVTDVTDGISAFFSSLEDPTMRSFYEDYFSCWDVEDYDTFQEFYDYAISYYLDYCEEHKTDPPQEELKINESYSAIVRKNEDTVKVGCQEIPIANIRKVVELYDRINS